MRAKLILSSCFVVLLFSISNVLADETASTQTVEKQVTFTPLEDPKVLTETPEQSVPSEATEPALTVEKIIKPTVIVASPPEIKEVVASSETPKETQSEKNVEVAPAAENPEPTQPAPQTIEIPVSEPTKPIETTVPVSTTQETVEDEPAGEKEPKQAVPPADQNEPIQTTQPAAEPEGTTQIQEVPPTTEENPEAVIPVENVEEKGTTFGQLLTTIFLVGFTILMSLMCYYRYQLEKYKIPPFTPPQFLPSWMFPRDFRERRSAAISETYKMIEVGDYNPPEFSQL